MFKRIQVAQLKSNFECQTPSKHLYRWNKERHCIKLYALHSLSADSKEGEKFRR